MSVADRLSTAATLLEDGQVMTLAYPTQSTYNPSTGGTTDTTPDPETVAGILFPLTPFRKTLGSIVEGDQQLLLAAQNTSGVAIAAPVVNGTVTDTNSDVWTLIAVEPLSPAGIAIMFDCIARRAG